MKNSKKLLGGQGNIEPDLRDKYKSGEWLEPEEMNELISDNRKDKFEGKSRSFCISYFHEDNEPKFDEKQMKYLCYSPEHTQEGKFHWQTYVYFKNQKTYKSLQSYIKKNWGEYGGAKKCKGNPLQNAIYCGKEKYEKDGKIKEANPEFKEFGELPVCGKRTDLIELKEKIINNECSVDDICIENPEAIHQYGRTLDRLEDIALRQRYRKTMTKGIWYYGKTGVGKSKKAYEEYNIEDSYNYPNDNGWWDGYKGQETVIINEFRGNIPFRELLELLDWTPKTVRRRGREPVPFLAKKVIFTSCKRPEDIYKSVCDDDDNIEQLLRRLEIIEITEKPKPIDMVDFFKNCGN